MVVKNTVENYLNNGFNKFFEHVHFSALLAAVADSCGNLTAALNSTDDGDGDVVWEYSSALFLCVTMLTTIGMSNN